MAITDKQRIARMKGIGSSDIGAIMGCNPFRSAHDVWLDKTGRAVAFEGNDHTRRGDVLEPAILQLASMELDEKIAAPKGAFVKGILRGNVDGQINRYGKGEKIVEAKSSLVDEGWGEPGTDEIPEHVFLQVMLQMMTAESDFTYAVKLGAFFKLDIYEIEYQRDIADMIEYSANKFWQDNVIADFPPPIDKATDGTLDYYGSRQRDGGKEALVDPKLCKEYYDAHIAMTAAESAKKLAKVKIQQQLGDCAVGKVEGFACRATTCKGRSSIDKKMLEKHYPEAYKAVHSYGNPYTMTTIKPK